ncbi:putative RNA-directed DNA polymerase [Helianthus annuus]|nr:putative RNA-directed DNA polymerase [Helianthus annuus]
MTIQETQCREMSENMVSRFWIRSNFEYSKVNANGRSGGLLSLWNPGVFKKNMEIHDRNFLLIKGQIVGESFDLTIINIYAPNIPTERRQLWEKLLTLREAIQGMWVLIGDFNEVRVPSDRLNSVFDSNNAMCFNNFISSGGFVEYPMTGRRFTYMTADGKKLSKIDRILVSMDFVNKWPNATLRALGRGNQITALLFLQQ